jgi:nucleotide-binding universal stress UspA family protein
VCDEARRQLCQLASELTSVRRVEFDIEAAAGSAPDEIVRAAERVDARLLVLGARGAGFLRRLVLGTTSQRLVRRTDRPLLVVRQTAASAVPARAGGGRLLTSLARCVDRSRGASRRTPGS